MLFAADRAAIASCSLLSHPARAGRSRVSLGDSALSPTPVLMPLLMLMLLLLLMLAACSAPDPAARMAQARLAREQGELRGAVILLKNLVQKDARHPGARLLLGELHLDLGDPQSAEKELRRAQALGSDGSTVLLLLGKAMLMQGHYERVLSDIQADAAPARRPAAIALRGNALLGMGKLDAARSAFTEALGLAPEAPEPLLGLARIALWERQHARAHTLVGRALAGTPGHVESLRFQSDLLRSEGKGDAALVAQQAILARHPHNAQALIDVASLHTDAGRLDLARASLAAARRVSGPGIGFLYADAMLKFRENKRDDALEAVQQILRVAPEHFPSVLLAGAVQAGQGAHQQAARHLQHFLQTYPAHPYASKLLAGVYLEQNAPAPALAALAPVLAAHGDDAELLGLAAEAHLRARRFSEATALFERAAALQPAAAALHTGLALSRMGNGDTARAVSELERANVLQRDPTRTGTLLVMSYLRANQTDKALAAVETMRQQGENPVLHNLTGGIYLARADVRSARAAFERALALEPAYLPALANLERLDALERRAGASRERYLAALAKAPSHTGLMEALARVELDAGRATEAVAWMDRARAQQPEHLPLALRTAAMLLRTGQNAKAGQLMRQLQTAHPADPAVLALAGQARAAGGEYSEAAETYARLASLQPRAAKPLVDLAGIHIVQRQYPAARAALSKALTLDPDSLDARITLVNLLLKLGKPGEAQGLAQAFIERHPERAAGYKLSGDVLAAQGQFAAASTAYRQAFAKAPSGPGLIQLTGMLDKLGRVAEVERLLVHWFAQHPADIPTRLHVASSKLVRGDPKAAIPHLEAVLAAQADNLAALNDLAWSYQRVGDARALALARRAHAQAPDNPAVMDTLGAIHLERGDLAGAMPLLQKASALAPRSPEIAYHYGMLLAKSGDRPGARRELNKALAAGDRFTRQAEARALLKGL